MCYLTHLELRVSRRKLNLVRSYTREADQILQYHYLGPVLHKEVCRALYLRALIQSTQHSQTFERKMAAPLPLRFLAERYQVSVIGGSVHVSLCHLLRWDCDYIFIKSVIFEEMWQSSLTILRILKTPLRGQMNKVSTSENSLLLPNIPLPCFKKSGLKLDL